MSRNIFVTGGAGNLGASLGRELIKDKNNDVVVADKFVTGSKSKLPVDGADNLTIYEADANSYEQLSKIMNNHAFDTIFHYAALVGVERTLKDPIGVLNDIDGIKAILDLSLEKKIKRVFFSSSSEVYGEPVEIPLNETTTPLNSRLPYAIVKNVGEAYFRSYGEVFGLDYTIMRFFNTYGPLQSDDFVIPRFVKRALNNEDIEINGDGLQTRTFLHVEDNVRFITSILNENTCINKTVNIGSADEISMINLAKLIINITKSESKIVHKPALEKGDMRRRKPDNSLMRELMPGDLISLEDGINRYIAEL